MWCSKSWFKNRIKFHLKVLLKRIILSIDKQKYILFLKDGNKPVLSVWNMFRGICWCWALHLVWKANTKLKSKINIAENLVLFGMNERISDNPSKDTACCDKKITLLKLQEFARLTFHGTMIEPISGCKRRGSIGFLQQIIALGHKTKYTGHIIFKVLAHKSSVSISYIHNIPKNTQKEEKSIYIIQNQDKIAEVHVMSNSI